MVRSIDPRRGKLRSIHWPSKVEIVFGTRVAETILASGYVQPHTKAAHMEASDLIKISAENACKREPSTYGWRRSVEAVVLT
jgi:hypothetical protein